MDKLAPFVGTLDERRETKVDTLLQQQQLLITWLKESVKLPSCLLSRSVLFIASPSPYSFPSAAPLKKINDQIK